MLAIKKTLALFCLLWLYCFLQPVSAQFQKMRIPAGTYPLGKDNIIRTYCIEYGIPNPGTVNAFKAGTKGIKVYRTSNGNTTQHTIDQAIENNQIQIIGTEGGNSIQIKVTDKKDAQYKLEVDEMGIIGGSKEEVAGVQTSFTEGKSLPLLILNAYLKRLVEIFGQESGVVKYFTEQTGHANQMLSNPDVEPSDIMEQVIKDMEKFQHAITELPDEYALEYLTAMHCSRLTSEQIDKSSDFFKKRLPVSYRKLFLKDLDACTATTNKLANAFGENFEMVNRFQQSILEKYKEDFDLKVATVFAERKGLLLEFVNWNGVEGNNGVIALFKGKKLSLAQQSVISEITGFEFRALPDAYSNYTYIIKGDDERFGGYAVRTTEQYKAVQENKDLFSVLNTHPNVLYDGPLTEDFLSTLDGHGIHYFCNSLDFLKNPPNKKYKIKLFFITSNNPATVRHLFDCDERTAKEIIGLNAEIAKIPNSIVVDSLLAIASELRKLAADEKPVFILFDDGGKVNFSRLMEVKDFGNSISFNTYSPELNPRPITGADYASTILALTEAQKNFGGAAVNILDFQRSYSTIYNRNILKEKKPAPLAIYGKSGQLIVVRKQ